MKQRLLAFVVLLVSLATGTTFAQKLHTDTYQVTVITKTGERSHGILEDVTNIAVYCDPSAEFNSVFNERVIPLANIRKIILRRTNKRLAVRAGAVVGAIALGVVAVQGLQRNPTRSIVPYGLTVVLTSGVGAAIGAGAGSLLGDLTRRVIRPRDRENSLDDFRRQLEPFSIRYQNDVFNRVNQ